MALTLLLVQKCGQRKGGGKQLYEGRGDFTGDLQYKRTRICNHFNTVLVRKTPRYLLIAKMVKQDVGLGGI